MNAIALQLNTWFGGARAGAVKQLVLPVFVVLMQLPLAQTSPGAQVFPHAPQLSLSESNVAQ